MLKKAGSLTLWMFLSAPLSLCGRMARAVAHAALRAYLLNGDPPSVTSSLNVVCFRVAHTGSRWQAT
jgi:hypothetical protein